MTEGQPEAEQNSFLELFASGAVAATIAEATTLPLDTAKVRDAAWQSYCGCVCQLGTWVQAPRHLMARVRFEVAAVRTRLYGGCLPHASPHAAVFSPAPVMSCTPRAAVTIATFRYRYHLTRPLHVVTGRPDDSRCVQVRLQLQSFGFTKGEATKVPTYRGTPLHVLATIIRNEGITGPFKVLCLVVKATGCSVLATLC